ncbi:3-methyladenine DNA glycosylase [Comamonas serinivorans]|uniref:3-methyladenine DNA glycosylase n=1 Tax=Comamonas serinivorans TaxID=1082851 RepID=A0A1Y0ELZ8_9BURK|nr:DNA-3-methyladenine glycosylase I [Comamonas serinivorans]ARU04379.1 3-methyladenine DNA glycosylase [Comamonas serinivorans]
MTTSLPTSAPDDHTRCAWCANVPEFLPYHDREWGFPVADDVRLFEKLSLEAFQSGLSWRTILNKREAFRQAFDHFDFHKVARYGEAEVTRLLADAGIVRHRGKIEAVIHNAARAVEMQQAHGSLAAYFWRHEPTPEQLATQLPQPLTASQIEASVKLSKDLKRLGWKFVGPTTVFAFMQAMGLVNDHARDCVTRAAVAQARQAFVVPR